LYQNKASIV